MEWVLLIVIQGLLELVANVLFFLPWQLLAGRDRSRNQPAALPPRATPSWVTRLADAVSQPLYGASLGSASGGMSLLVLPSLILHNQYGRVGNLFVTPIALGLLAHWLARRRLKRGTSADPKRDFWFAIGFSMAFMLVRFFWAEYSDVTQ